MSDYFPEGFILDLHDTACRLRILCQLHASKCNDETCYLCAGLKPIDEAIKNAPCFKWECKEPPKSTESGYEVLLEIAKIVVSCECRCDPDVGHICEPCFYREKLLRAGIVLPIPLDSKSAAGEAAK